VRHLYNLSFALALSIILLGANQLFTWVEPRFQFSFNLNRLWGYFIFFFFLSYVPRGKFTKSVYGFILMGSFAEMVHLSFFGSLIFPIGFFLAFTQVGEISQALLEVLEVLIWPVLFLLFSIVGIYFASRTLGRKTRQHRWMLGLVIFLLLFAPLRSLINHDSFGKRPDSGATAFYNFYASLTYFSVEIGPRLVSGDQPRDPVTPFPPVLRPGAAQNLVVILGESINLNHMSLYGYPKSTTPFLESLQNQPGFFKEKGVACGVSTDVAVPLLINGLCSPGAMPQIVSTNSCLFRLAKTNGYQTWFMTAQAGDSTKGILNYLCPKYIDHFYHPQNLIEDAGYYTHLKDMELVEILDRVDWSKKNFILLQQRSSHTPYGENYPKSMERFPKIKGERTSEKVIRTYDNSLAYSDEFFKRTIEKVLAKSPGPVMFLLTSDHGEAMGEGGRFGHLRLFKEQYMVPWLFYQSGGGEWVSRLQEAKRPLSHVDFHRLAAGILGYEWKGFTPQEKTMVLGTDIFGYAGYLRLLLQKQGIKELSRH